MKQYLLIFCLGMLFTHFNVMAGNPGISAMDCITTSTSPSEYNNYTELTFKNSCNFKVFVLWCGDLKYSKKQCGDGSGNRFYTHSTNIKAYGSGDTDITKGGSYKYAACVGGIGFGSEGIEHPAYDNGSFRCTKRGK